MKPILAVMVGISGSGKSTFASGLRTSLKAELVQTDTIRAELTGNAEDQSQNGKVFAIAKSRINDYLSSGKNAIIDATSLDVKARKDWIEIGKANNAEMRAYFVDTPVDVAKRQNTSRTRKVPEFVINKQASKLQSPTKAEGFDSVTTI
jgi:protein phosphatase